MQPGVFGVGPGPQADVGVPALVSGSRRADAPQRQRSCLGARREGWPARTGGPKDVLFYSLKRLRRLELDSLLALTC